MRPRVLFASLRCLLLPALCFARLPVEAGEPKSPARAQDEIAAIRQRWQEVEEKARNATKEGGFYITEVKANARDAGGVPAVGSRQGTVTFEWEWNEDSEDPYDTRLLRATESMVVAGRTYRLTFLFSPDGKLLFCHCLPAEPEEAAEEDTFLRPRSEWRLYFAGDRVLRRMRGKTVLDRPLPQEERVVRPLLKRAESIQRLYAETEMLMR